MFIIYIFRASGVPIIIIGLYLLSITSSFGQEVEDLKSNIENTDINSNRAFETYHLDSLKNNNGSFDAINSLVGKVGITTDNFYAAGFRGAKIQNRMQRESLVLLHDVPMNGFDMFSDNVEWELFSYISALGVNDYQVTKGSGGTGEYGAMGQNGVISMSQRKSEILGLSGGVISQFNRNNSHLLPVENYQHHGGFINFASDRLSMHLDTELNKGASADNFASQNISLSSTYEISKK